jgi:hypothetical protein
VVAPPVTPVIYLTCFHESRFGFAAYALSEDGTGLGSHLSSNIDFAKHDIGLTSDWHHEFYKQRYPDGYHVEWIDNPDDDPRWLAAMKLNESRYAESLEPQP